MNGQLALFTDLYELTMLQAYFDQGLDSAGVFDCFVRELPSNRNFLLVCGLDDVLTYLEEVHFTADNIAYLRSLGQFSEPFLQYLAGFRFTGTVRAMPEGSIAFPPEPILQVEAPLPQAQLVETLVLNQLGFGTLIASKGARVVLAAGDRAVVDFGSRRAHGTDAANKAARALYLAGFHATSNVLAGQRYGIPVAGTMAHSFVQAYEDEAAAFRAFVASNPNTIVLVDTYDTLEGVRKVIALSKELGDAFRVRGIRLDSGNLKDLASSARRMLDDAGLTGVQITASGGLNEFVIASLASAPIDSFGVGTSVVVSDDAPTLDAVYKLVAYDGRAVMKLSADKATLPGPKQVYRRWQQHVPVGDTIALAGEPMDGTPMLVEVMHGGRRTAAGRAALGDGRAYARAQLKLLPQQLRALTPVEPYPVQVSSGLRDLELRLRGEIQHKSGR